MKTRIIPLACCAAILASIPFWNHEASAQPDGASPSVRSSAASSAPDLPLGESVIVTLDPESDSRSELTKEIRRYAGFAHHDTVEGVLIHMDAEWLVLKGQAGTDRNWIPRDKVLLLHVNP